MIAISYRREDSKPVAGRIYDRLQAEFGKENVFMDFDSIPFGVDFREHIQRTLQKADVLIAIIGPDWAGAKSQPQRRIEEPTDFVRLEIAAALQYGIPIIPVLIDDTRMPNAATLPTEIEGLAFRNGIDLDTGIDFHHHADRLVTGIRKVLHKSDDAGAANAGTDSARREPKSRAAMITLLTIAAFICAGAAAWLVRSKLPEAPVVAQISPTPQVSITPVASPVLQASATIAPPPPPPSATLPPMITAEAELARGDALRNGIGIQQDLVEAMACYQRAAAMGNAPAAHRMGVMYAMGTGVPKDDVQAVEWYRKAADHGQAEAQYDLGVRYILGLGVPKDEKTGLEWYRKAAALGWQQAIDALSDRERGTIRYSGHYSGKVGNHRAEFDLTWSEDEGRVSGYYNDTDNGKTYHLEGRMEKEKLLLDEYTGEKISARLELTRQDSNREIQWVGTAHNAPPDERNISLSFARPVD